MTRLAARFMRRAFRPACTKKRTATRAKVSKTGTFTFTMRPRDAGTPYALYRVQAKIGRTSRSYSTQVAVTR
jgi:hypothetical protein